MITAMSDITAQHWMLPYVYMFMRVWLRKQVLAPISRERMGISESYLWVMHDQRKYQDIRIFKSACKGQVRRVTRLPWQINGRNSVNCWSIKMKQQLKCGAILPLQPRFGLTFGFQDHQRPHRKLCQIQLFLCWWHHRRHHSAILKIIQILDQDKHFASYVMISCFKFQFN